MIEINLYFFVFFTNAEKKMLPNMPKNAIEATLIASIWGGFL